MPIRKLLGSKGSRSAVVLSVLAQAARELQRGDYRVGSVLLGLALLAYRSTIAGIAAQIALWWYRKRTGKAKTPSDARPS